MQSELPETMRAIIVTGPGGPEVLREERVPLPAPAAGEVLIKVSHAGVNRPDCLQRAGLYPPPKTASELLGLEVSGTIACVGEGVEPVLAGTMVCALTNGGGYAEYCAVPAGQCLPVPESLSMAEAAAIPETLFTVWHNVFQRGMIRDGEILLVHGGTSGIGSMAIKLAKLFDITAITTCGSDAKCDMARAIGADLAINYREADFVEALREYTEGKGANVILDMVAGEYTQRNLDCLAVDGRLVTIATLGGIKAEINVVKLMMKRQTLTGSTLRARSNDFKALLADEIADNVWPLAESGALKPQMDEIFALTDAAEAHRKIEAGQHFGKIVLQAEQG